MKATSMSRSELVDAVAQTLLDIDCDNNEQPRISLRNAIGDESYRRSAEIVVRQVLNAVDARV